MPRQLANVTHAHPLPESLPLAAGPCSPAALRGIRRDFSRLSPCNGQVAYALLTRAPVAGRREQALSPDAPRLACVRPVASVHPEPGSNSPLFVFSLNLFRLYIRCIAVYRTSGRFIAVLDLTKRRVMLYDPSLVLLIVYCKYFKVLCLSPRVSGWRKNDAKLKLIFQTTKLFWGNFCFHF